MVSFHVMEDSKYGERRVLILTDGKAGHENQSRAFVRALGCSFDLVTVRFKCKLAKAASYILDRLGVASLGLMEFPENPDFPESLGREYIAVVGTGSGTFYAVKTLARKLGVKSGVVLTPSGYDLATFDCILSPSFDNPPKMQNIVEIPANLVAADAEFYEKGVAAFRERTDVVPETAVIIGGPNKCSTMTPEWMRGRLDEIFACPGVKAVTTSRRTPPDVEAVVDSYPWDYRLIYSRDNFNPIPAFVSLAKRLYVTAESTGMLSEACTSGSAKVIALDNLKPGPSKFRRFVDGLRDGGYVDGSRKIDLSAQFEAARRLMGLCP